MPARALERVDVPGRVRLGLALQARATDVAATICRRVSHETVNTYRNCSLATEAVGRWLAGGGGATEQENGVLAANGRASADGVISVADMTKNYLTWRDVTSEALVEEAARLALDELTLRSALDRVRASCDSSLVRMAKQYDAKRVEMEHHLATERDALSHQALHDALTGLANRVLLLQRMTSAATGPSPRLLAVLFLDVDGFKAVNDGLGHDAGDKLLVAVAARLSALVHPGDTVARLGGDEFVILCEDLRGGQDAAEALAERVQLALAEPFVVLGGPLLISASIGVAVAPADADPEVVLAHADGAMYAAKQRGRARYATHDGHAQARAVRAALLRRALPWALQRGELHLHYQPVTALPAGRVVSVEALLRWTHPEFGAVSPMEFIALAEEGPLICSIGAWVLAEACRQTACWRVEHGGDLGVAVNLSVRQLEDPDLVAVVRDVLHQTGLPPHALTLEITESKLMEHPEQAVTVLAGLKDLGLRLAIDDFGTGYSSLAYLRRLPVDVLKVDRSFVTALRSDERGQAATILRAMIGLAHDLGLLVIAEGVEQETELDALRALGCDQAQGYLFARPAPPRDIEAEVRRTITRSGAERREH